MDAHQPAEPNVPVWYIGHHLPTPNVGINIGTLEEEISNGVNLPPKEKNNNSSLELADL